MGNICNTASEETIYSRPPQRTHKLSIKGYNMSMDDDEMPGPRRVGQTTSVNKHLSFKHLRGFR